MVHERSRRPSVEISTFVKLEHANQWNIKIEKYASEQLDSSAIKCSKILDRQPEVETWASVGLAEVGVLVSENGGGCKGREG